MATAVASILKPSGSSHNPTNRSLLATMMKPAMPSGSRARIQADRRISAELADSSLRAWLTSRMKAAMRSST